MEGLPLRIRNLDLIVALCIAVSGMGWALLPNHSLFVGALLALPLVFILPGYTLTQALFRKRPPYPSNGLILQPRLKIGFGAADHVVFSLGLSLVIDIVVGFLLNLAPVGLQWQSWTLSLGLITAVFALLAALLRRSQPVTKRGAAGWRITFKEGALLGLALVVATLALWLSITRPPQPQPSFTQFWMLSATQANHSCAVRIGVQSFEVAAVTYHIQVTSNGRQVATWPAITLAARQEWDHLVSISPAAVGAVVEARLYRLDRPGTIYREVHLTLRGCGS